jgi:hypothetical protein
MRNGTVFICPRCNEHVDPSQPWDLGHTADRHGYLGPMHIRCNRDTADATARSATRGTTTSTKRTLTPQQAPASDARFVA